MVLAGNIVDAADIAVPYYLAKATSESVTSSTAFQNDDDFVLALPVGVWRVELRLTVSGPSASDLKVTWTNTGTMALIGRSVVGPSTATTDTTSGLAKFQALALGSSGTYGTDGSNSASVWEDLLIEVTVAGTLTMQWAQNGSGTATTLSASSRVFLTKVEEWPG